MKFFDISTVYEEGMTIYSNNPPFRVTRVSDMSKGDACNVMEVSFGSHTGTHIDAPRHFIADGMTLEQIPLERMNGKAKVIDASGLNTIAENFLREQKIEEDDILLFRTDNSKKENQGRILKDYVTLDYDAAKYLAGCKIKMIGIDYLTVERPRHRRISGESVHGTLLSNQILVLEGINMEDIVEGEYLLFCLPLKIKGADGCPVRAVLTVDG